MILWLRFKCVKRFSYLNNSVCVCIYIYIYIYIERERESERERDSVDIVSEISMSKFS